MFIPFDTRQIDGPMFDERFFRVELNSKNSHVEPAFSFTRGLSCGTCFLFHPGPAPWKPYLYSTGVIRNSCF